MLIFSTEKKTPSKKRKAGDALDDPEEPAVEESSDSEDEAQGSQKDGAPKAPIVCMGVGTAPVEQWHEEKRRRMEETGKEYKAHSQWPADLIFVTFGLPTQRTEDYPFASNLYDA